MQLLGADAKVFSKKCFFFCPKKVEKTHPQKLLRKLKYLHLFSLLH